MAFSRILGPDGQPIQTSDLTRELAAPSNIGVRQPWHASAADNLTPQRLTQILQSAIRGDAHQYLTLAEEMEERDMHYASVLGTRKLAIVGLTIRVDAATDAADDVAKADAIRALVDTPEFGEMISNQVDALGKGYAVSEILWDRSAKEWMPDYIDRDQRFFRWDDTGRELRLLDEADAARGIALPEYKFIVHRPRIRSGLPIRGGLARLAAPAYMCKAWTWKDWMAFADIYGMPMRIGTYGPGTTPQEINRLIDAVSNLGSDAAGVIPESTKITLQAAAQTGGAGDFFEKLATFWDKQISKGVLGQTMTADDGSSQSQANVHNDVRMDLLQADAKALSNTLNRMLVRPFIDLNHGPGSYPKLVVVVPEPEDTKALVEALNILVPLGLRVETSVIRDKLGIPDPAKDAEVLTAPAPKPEPSPIALNRALNVELKPAPDYVDVLTGLLSERAGKVTDGWLAHIRTEVAAASDFDDLLGRLADLLTDLPLDELGQMIAGASGVADRAGRADVMDDARA